MGDIMEDTVNQLDQTTSRILVIVQRTLGNLNIDYYSIFFIFVLKVIYFRKYLSF